MLSVDVSLILLLGSNKIYNILFKNLNISCYYFEIIEKKLKFNFVEDLFCEKINLMTTFSHLKKLGKQKENLANGNATKHKETDVGTKRTF